MKLSDSAYLLVRVGGRRVGLELGSVVEVLEPGPVYPVPSAVAAVRGVSGVRGVILPVVDLAALLAGTGCATDRAETVVVVQVNGQRVCLEVDDAEEVLRGGGLPFPPGSALPWAAGVARHPEGLIPLLDLTALGSRISETASA
jgi:chemotaxis signal transduction protein